MGKKQFKGLKPFITYFKKKYKAEKIILFGSRARGDFFNDSDYDLLVVSEKFIKNYVQRLIDIHKDMPTNLPVDVIPLTPEEFKKGSRQLTIIQEAVKTGKVIYAS